MLNPISILFTYTVNVITNLFELSPNSFYDLIKVSLFHPYIINTTNI
jgi:hypothetical protein